MRCGLLKGASHKKGGINLRVLGTDTIINAEGNEYIVPENIYNSDKIFTFKGTNIEVLNYICGEKNAVYKYDYVKPNDVIINKASVTNDTVRQYNGTADEILNLMNVRGCGKKFCGRAIPIKHNKDKAMSWINEIEKEFSAKVVKKINDNVYELTTNNSFMNKMLAFFSEKDALDYAKDIVHTSMISNVHNQKAFMKFSDTESLRKCVRIPEDKMQFMIDKIIDSMTIEEMEEFSEKCCLDEFSQLQYLTEQVESMDKNSEDYNKWEAELQKAKHSFIAKVRIVKQKELSKSLKDPYTFFVEENRMTKTKFLSLYPFIELNCEKVSGILATLSDIPGTMVKYKEHIIFNQ